MNISSTTGISSLASVSSTSAARNVNSTTDNPATTEVGESTSGSDKTKLSKLGELMSKLQDLEGSDPAKAKQVLTSIASALTEKANSSDNSDPHLQELADKFTEAAKTGDLSALKPTGGKHHHRPEGPPPPPPPSGDATTAAATASKTASYTQRAANPAEQLASIISQALSDVAT